MADDSLDLDRRLCELQPPRFTAGGHEYVGKLVSWEQAVAWGQRAEALGVAFKRTDRHPERMPAAKAQMAALLVEMARDLFPEAPPPPWWRRWSRVPPAHEVVAGMHETLQLETLQSFYEALATMMPRNPAPTTAATRKNPRSRPSAKPRISGGDSPTRS